MIDARHLWTAVLKQAILDLTDLRVRTEQRRYRATQRYFVRLWFLSDNHDPGSFKWICDHIELDASWLRRRLFAIVDGPKKATTRTAVQREGLSVNEDVTEGQKRVGQVINFVVPRPGQNDAMANSLQHHSVPVAD